MVWVFVCARCSFLSFRVCIVRRFAIWGPGEGEGEGGFFWGEMDPVECRI